MLEEPGIDQEEHHEKFKRVQQQDNIRNFDIWGEFGTTSVVGRPDENTRPDLGHVMNDGSSLIHAKF